MRLETCIHIIHGLVDICLCSGYQKITVLSASATECLLRQLVLAPSLSPDCLQGCCRGGLPYTVNQLLTGSLPKTPHYRTIHQRRPRWPARQVQRNGRDLLFRCLPKCNIFTDFFTSSSETLRTSRCYYMM